MAARIAKCWVIRTSHGRHNFMNSVSSEGISEKLFRDIILATAAKLGGRL